MRLFLIGKVFSFYVTLLFLLVFSTEAMGRLSEDQGGDTPSDPAEPAELQIEEPEEEETIIPDEEPKHLETPEEMTPTAIKPSLSHKHQIGVEIGFGWGYRLIKPYGDIWCGERDGNDNATFCTSAVPAFMEIGLSFGVSKSVDLVVDFKYGLQRDDVSDRRPMILMPGVRFWMNPESAFKWALGLQLVMDFTKQDGKFQQDYNKPKKDSFDFGGRFYAQMQYDFLKYLGLYIKGSGMVGAVRWVRMEMELQGGVQARFP